MNDEILRLINDLQRRIEALETGEVVGLDWDKTWTDAVHDHSNNAEGGVLPQDAVKVSKLVASDGSPNPALSADLSGYLSAAVQPLFSAYVSSSVPNVTGDGTTYTVIFDTEITDRNSNYNTVTGIFTAPVPGLYLFRASIVFFDLTSSHTPGLMDIVTSNRNYRLNESNPYVVSYTGYFEFVGSAICDLDAGDTAYITLYVTGGAKVVDVYGVATNVFTGFSGYLLS